MSRPALRALSQLAKSHRTLLSAPALAGYRNCTSASKQFYTRRFTSPFAARLTTRSFASSSLRPAPKYVRFNVDPEKPWDVSRWDTTTKVLVGVLLGCGVYYVAHLERAPETGRWRFMDISPRKESALAKEAHEQLVQEYGSRILPENHPLHRHVHRVVARILEASNLGVLKSSAPSAAKARAPSLQDVWDPDADSGRQENLVPGVGGREWQLMVVNDDKMVNAAASYGNIIVYTGILPIAKDQDGLAAVLGHEIGHVVARHNSERASSVKVLLVLASLLDVLGLDIGITRLLTTLLYELPNSRTQEFEADTIGLKLMSKACFDPRASPAMFTRLSQLENTKGGVSVSFLSTHPSGEQRIQRLEQMLPEAFTIQAASPACQQTADYFSAFHNAFSGTGAFAGASSEPRWT